MPTAYTLFPLNRKTDELMSIDVASLERAIVAAVSPPQVRELAGWIAAFDDGTVRRARSAAPLSHTMADPACVAPIREEYFTRGLAPMFRVPQMAAFAQVENELARSAMHARQPTDV